MTSAMPQIVSWKRAAAALCRPAATLSRAAAALLVGVFTANSAGVAKAQVTVESLTQSAVGDSSTAPFYDDVQDAIRRFEKGDIEGTRKLLELARKSQPKLAPVEVMIAQLLVAANQMPAARAELERALRESPKDPEAYIVLAESNLQEGRVSEAAMMYKLAAPVLDAFSENPKRKDAFLPRLYSGAAAAAEAREDWTTARDDLAKLITVEGKNSNDSKQVADGKLAAAHMRLARALFKLDDANESYRQLQAAAVLDPKQIAPEVAMAALYRQAKKNDKADAAIAKAIRNSPGNFATLAGLARWMYEANKISEAVTYCDAAAKVDPTSIEVKLLRAMLARMQKDNAKALELLEQVHMETPTNSIATNQLALVLAESKNDATLKRAAQFAELNAKLNPKNAEALTTLAWTLFKLGRKAEAQQALFAAIRGGGGQMGHESAYLAAVILNELDRKAEAARAVDGALLSDAPFVYHDEAAALQTKLNRQLGRGDTSKREPDSSATPDAGSSGKEAPTRPASAKTPK